MDEEKRKKNQNYKSRSNYRIGGCLRFDCININTKKCEDCIKFSKYEDKIINKEG